MPTDKPRIQVYLEPELYQKLIEWKEEREISKISEALNQVVAEYFGVSPQSPIPNPQPSITTEQIEEIINERINARFEQLDNRLKAAEKMLDVQNGVPTLFQEALQTVRYQEYVIEDLLPTELEAKLNDLAVRLDAVEDSLEVVLGESPSGSLAQSEAPGLEEADSPNADAGEKWKIGDRVRVLCKSNYEKMTGTIVDYLEALGWGVHVDRWWTVSGISESVIDERQKKGSSIWCDADEMELLIESPSESLTQFEATRSPGQLPQDEALGHLPPRELGNNALARRLGVSGSSVLRNREKPNFEEWSKGHDPDAIAWRYDRKTKVFIALGR